MKKEDIDILVQLREYLIREHNKLDGKSSPRTAIIRQIEVANIIEHSVRKIDVLLKEHVKFE